MSDSITVSYDGVMCEWIAKTDYNGSVVAKGHNRERVVERARDYAYYQNGFTHVSVELKPKKMEEDS